MAMISELAPKAVPVTGPTTKVQAPAPMVVRLSASVIPKVYAMITPDKKEIMTPKNKERTPIGPVFLMIAKLAPIAVETMAKSRNIGPPMISNPEKPGMSARPFLPRVSRPVK